MRARLLLRSLVVFAALSCSLIPPCRATVVNFDDFSPRIGGQRITNAYGGLVWSNLGVANTFLDANDRGYLTGYNYGMITPSNVAYNAFGLPAEVDAAGTNFNFLSAFLTGAWNSNLNIQVQGFRAGALIYDETVVAAATNATLFIFNYENIDRLYFNSFGGQPAFGPISQAHFAMDNLTFEFVPEPSALLLTGAGVALLWAFHKRKRTG
jgi:hypothetical protein